MAMPGNSKRSRQVHPLIIHVRENQRNNGKDKRDVEAEPYKANANGNSTRNKSDEEQSSSHWQEFVEQTTFHGIKYVFMERQMRVRRCMWLGLILTAIGLFTYQVFDRTRNFLDYHSTVNVKPVHAHSLDFPAVTICNLNRYRMTKTAELGLYHYINNINSNLSFEVALPEKVQTLNPNKVIQATAHQVEDLIARCTYERKPCNITEDFKPRFTRLGLCYTFNGNNDSAQVTQSGVGFGLSLMINIESYENIKGLEEQVGVKMLLHDPQEEPLVKDLGFVVAPGTHTLIGVKQTRLSHLPEPHGQCRPEVSYTSNCVSKNRAQKVASECHCKEPFLQSSVIGAVPLCNMKQILTCVLRNVKPEDDTFACPLPCNRITFEPVLSYAQLSKMIKTRIGEGVISKVKHDYFHAMEVARRVDREIALAEQDTISTMEKKVNSYQKSISRFIDNMKRLDGAMLTRILTIMNATYNVLLTEIKSREIAYKSIGDVGQDMFFLQIDLGYILDGRTGIYNHDCAKPSALLGLTNITNIDQIHSANCFCLPYFTKDNVKFLQSLIHNITIQLHSMRLYVDDQGRLINRTVGWGDDDAYVTCLGKRLDSNGLWIANFEKALQACKLYLQSSPSGIISRNQAVAELIAFHTWITANISAASDFGLTGEKTCALSNTKTWSYLKETHGKFISYFQPVIQWSLNETVVNDSVHSCLLECKQLAVNATELFHSLLESYQEGNEANTQKNGYFYSILFVKSVQDITEAYDRCIRLAQIYTGIFQEVENNLRNVASLFKEFDRYQPLRKVITKHFGLPAMKHRAGEETNEHLLSEIDFIVKTFFKPLQAELNITISDFAALNKVMNPILGKFEHLVDRVKDIMDDERFVMKNYFMADIFYRSLSYEEISQQKAFEFLSLLSEIGGFLGLLLGASVLTMFELLDHLAMVAMNKCRNNKQRKT